MSSGVMNFKDSLKLVELYHEFKYTFEENLLKGVFQSYFALFRVQWADSMQIIDRTGFAEFGGELGDQQKPKLERKDMKLGPFQKNR